MPIESIADMGVEMPAKLIYKLSDSWRSSKTSRMHGSHYRVIDVLSRGGN